MSKRVCFKELLEDVRIATLVLYFIAAGFAAWDHMGIAILILLLAFCLEQLHRCPHCRAYLDTRTSLRKLHVCSNCGQDLDGEVELRTFVRFIFHLG